MTPLRKLTYLILTIIAIAVVVMYYCYDPSGDSFFPRCLWLSATGYRCPGCGTQRALHALLHGHLLDALKFNPLVLVAPALIAVTLLADRYRDRLPLLYRVTAHPLFIAAIFVLVVAWWILRNIFDL